MIEEYIISFSSFYKAAYAQDVLEYEGIKSALKKIPSELVRSCSTGLYLKTSDISKVKNVFNMKRIVPTGIFKVKRDENGNRRKYIVMN